MSVLKRTTYITLLLFITQVRHQKAVRPRVLTQHIIIKNKLPLSFNSSITFGSNYLWNTQTDILMSHIFSLLTLLCLVYECSKQTHIFTGCSQNLWTEQCLCGFYSIFYILQKHYIAVFRNIKQYLYSISRSSWTRDALNGLYKQNSMKQKSIIYVLVLILRFKLIFSTYFFHFIRFSFVFLFPYDYCQQM